MLFSFHSRKLQPLAVLSVIRAEDDTLYRQQRDADYVIDCRHQTSTGDLC